MTDKQSVTRAKAHFGLANINDGFDLGVTLTAYWHLQKHDPDPSNDELLHKLDNETYQTALLPLLIDLSMADPIFYDLSSRMCAASLIKMNGSVGKFIGQITARLLLLPKPSVGKKKIGRDVGLIIAVTYGIRLGLKPTESISKPSKDAYNSGCRKVSTELHKKYGISVIDYSAIERIWKRRREILLEVGFTEKDISDFSP
ncbi:hypothetical protein [Profundibacter sp.]